MSSSNGAANTSNIYVENWEPIDPQEPEIHHLPFKIGYTGPAGVSKYFLIKQTTNKVDQDAVESGKGLISTYSRHKRVIFVIGVTYQSDFRLMAIP